MITHERCGAEFFNADHLVKHSPKSYRVCINCGIIQVLKFSGWEDEVKFPVRARM